jgi:hypothetical protein
MNRGDGTARRARRHGFPHNLLDYGRTIGAGSASDVLNNPAVIAPYIGTQAIS